MVVRVEEMEVEGWVVVMEEADWDMEEATSYHPPLQPRPPQLVLLLRLTSEQGCAGMGVKMGMGRDGGGGLCPHMRRAGEWQGQSPSRRMEKRDTKGGVGRKERNIEK